MKTMSGPFRQSDITGYSSSYFEGGKFEKNGSRNYDAENQPCNLFGTGKSSSPNWSSQNHIPCISIP